MSVSIPTSRRLERAIMGMPYLLPRITKLHFRTAPENTVARDFIDFFVPGLKVAHPNSLDVKWLKTPKLGSTIPSTSSATASSAPVAAGASSTSQKAESSGSSAAVKEEEKSTQTSTVDAGVEGSLSPEELAAVAADGGTNGVSSHAIPDSAATSEKGVLPPVSTNTNDVAPLQHLDVLEVTLQSDEKGDIDLAHYQSSHQLMHRLLRL
ncbi:unnamed protein product [Amoebophrya sp. A120]|nr:unnamed protein product [Amoebophrya sp. A120]|eukprot:GSA120T00019337001.1